MTSTCAYAGWPNNLNGQVARDIAYTVMLLYVSGRILTGDLVPESYETEIGCQPAGLMASQIVKDSVIYAGITLSFNIDDISERNGLCTAWDGQIGQSEVGTQCDVGNACVP